MEENKNMIKCAVCGEPIAKSAKFCPKCGAKVKKPWYKKWYMWILVFYIVSLLLSILAYVDSNDANTPDTSTQTTQQQTTEQQTTGQQANQQQTSQQKNVQSSGIVVTADELAAAYSENEAKGNTLYKGKIIELSGTVTGFGHIGFGNQSYINLATNTDTSIQCYFMGDNGAAQVAQIKEDDFVNVVGEVKGKTLVIEVDRCQLKSIQQKSSEPDMVITPDDLANAYAQNEVKGDSLYKDKNVEISGYISSIGNGYDNDVRVLFDTSSEDHIECYFKDPDDIAKIAEMNEGDYITAIGKVSGKTGFTRYAIEIHKCKLK